MKLAFPPIRCQCARGRFCTRLIPMPRNIGMPSSSMKRSQGVFRRENSPKPARLSPPGSCQCGRKKSCMMVSASSLFLLIIGSGGASWEFARFVAGEIGGGGAFDAVLTVDGGVDLVTRKNEPIFLGLVFHASHFAEPQERGRFFHGGVVFRFARGLEIL